MKCPHCLVEFRPEVKWYRIDKDVEGEWGIEKYVCPNEKCNRQRHGYNAIQRKPQLEPKFYYKLGICKKLNRSIQSERPLLRRICLWNKSSDWRNW